MGHMHRKNLTNFDFFVISGKFATLKQWPTSKSCLRSFEHIGNALPVKLHLDQKKRKIATCVGATITLCALNARTRVHADPNLIRLGNRVNF